uniref:Chromophore lyase CpcS/CpeS n=1 Tax=Gracilaria caudata TaxID=2572395 RepID=A0A345U6K9_9FLOR|nr:hypothetical protein [Gracilaria caudata]YP_010196139.1 hypothetical protein LK014_pgp124 [Gracilaria caudata]AXI96095.1 hypothetical protein [Gracilaria caudata]UAD83536.1 hypothetical protein [Gracilaria caudata]
MIYENILNKLEGQWICQRSNYFIHKKKVDYNKQEINLKQIENIYIREKEDHLIYNYHLYNKKNYERTYYLFFQDKRSNIGELHKITNDEIKYYRFKIYTHNCIKIESVKKNILYYEYIYLINPKFKITICVLKENHKYLAASFISEIKVSN